MLSYLIDTFPDQGGPDQFLVLQFISQVLATPSPECLHFQKLPHVQDLMVAFILLAANQRLVHLRQSRGGSLIFISFNALEPLLDQSEFLFNHVDLRSDVVDLHALVVSRCPL